MNAEQDPMLHGNEQEQEAYKAFVSKAIMDAIAKDREARREVMEDSPAAILGSAGMAQGAIIRSLDP